MVEMIRVIVAEEVRKLLPKVVSEMYIKNLVHEAVGSPVQPQRPPSPQRQSMKFEDIYEKELSNARDEHVPEMMDNSDEGIYQQGTITRKNETARSALFAKENPLLASMFKNVVPTNMREGAGKPSIPIMGPVETNSRGELEMSDPSRYGEIFRKMSGQSNKGIMQQTTQGQERALEERRKKLDEIRIDTSKAPITR